VRYHISISGYLPVDDQRLVLTESRTKGRKNDELKQAENCGESLKNIKKSERTKNININIKIFGAFNMHETETETG
jgi:hypothetical protein